MLQYKNIEDREEMMNYHRARDMINLLIYFPELSPILDLTIVKSLEDYYENYEELKDLKGERNDTLITKPSMKSVEGSGKNPDIPSIFKRVKELDEDGVLILFRLNHPFSERYERYVGISLAVSAINAIYIEAVGKGFDGREVSKGICAHERYVIPWIALRSCHISNFKDYRTYKISDDLYEQTRIDRIQFLESLHLPIKKIEKEVPEKYEDIPDFIWQDIIQNILKKLPVMEEELISSNLIEFAISGHTEGKRFLPWQIFDKTRYDIGRK